MIDKMFYRLGRILVGVVIVFWTWLPRLAFDVVCKWDPAHRVLWQIPAFTLALLALAGGIAGAIVAIGPSDLVHK